MITKSDKTKKLIEDTLVKLMLEKDFDKISVKDITDALDINRGTFYLHFTDKYDLLEQKENEIIEEFNQIVIKALKEQINNFVLPSDRNVLLHVFIQVYTHIKENGDFMKVILGPKGDLNFQMKIRNHIENWLVSNVSVDGDAEKMPIKYLAAVASSAQLGVIQKWVKSGMKESPEELAQFISNTIFSIYNGVIKNY